MYGALGKPMEGCNQWYVKRITGMQSISGFSTIFFCGISCKYYQDIGIDKLWIDLSAILKVTFLYNDLEFTRASCSF